jgi:diadenosine tetraphosphatase ApaH/serine/threonine PP2A family protein phosphatase
MRIALFTDIHANREALSACMAHARLHGADQFGFLGDLIGYGGDPGWVLDTVMHHVERGAIALLGNHDVAVAGQLRAAQAAPAAAPARQMHAEALEAVMWTCAQLSPAHAEFLGQLPYSVERGDVLYVHASAHLPKQWEYIRTPVEAERSFRATAARVTFCGHVHKPALYRLNGEHKVAGMAPKDGASFSLDPQHRYLAIPGACGQPRDGNCNACYALYDDATNTLRYFRVPYDFGAAARRVIAVGLPMVFAMRLIEAV